ncbi:MAG: APC family permease [Myxococcales bacterium]|nr:APC family permease [Myxococcales bacterium]
MSQAPEKRGALGSLTLLGLGVNGIVGVGIFVAPKSVTAAVPGPQSALMYLALATTYVPMALVYARLSRALPYDGGPALYAQRAFGAGFAQAIAVLCWVSALFSTAAVTRALAERLSPAHTSLVAVAICGALVLVNARGLSLSAWAWTLLTALKLAPLLVLAGLGLVTTARPTVAAPTTPLGPALLAVLFALQGFEIVRSRRARRRAAIARCPAPRSARCCSRACSTRACTWPARGRCRWSPTGPSPPRPACSGARASPARSMSACCARSRASSSACTP